MSLEKRIEALEREREPKALGRFEFMPGMLARGEEPRRGTFTVELDDPKGERCDS